MNPAIFHQHVLFILRDLHNADESDHYALVEMNLKRFEKMVREDEARKGKQQ